MPATAEAPDAATAVLATVPEAATATGATPVAGFDGAATCAADAGAVRADATAALEAALPPVTLGCPDVAAKFGAAFDIEFDTVAGAEAATLAANTADASAGGTVACTIGIGGADDLAADPGSALARAA